MLMLKGEKREIGLVIDGDLPQSSSLIFIDIFLIQEADTVKIYASELIEG